MGPIGGKMLREASFNEHFYNRNVILEPMTVVLNAVPPSKEQRISSYCETKMFN